MFLSDEEFERQCNRIRALSDKWRVPLGLDEWHLQFIYDRAPLKDDDGKYDDEIAGKATVRWEYRRATLTFGILACMDMDDDELESVFVHECGHVLVHEMRNDTAGEGIPHEERVVTTLERAFRNAYEAGRKQGKHEALTLGDGAVVEV